MFFAVCEAEYLHVVLSRRSRAHSWQVLLHLYFAPASFRPSLIVASASVFLFVDGDSGESSSDSDGGPGFFDGINDNPSEEAVFAASSAKKSNRGREPLGGAFHGGGDGGGADVYSETADLAAGGACTDGHNRASSRAAAAAARGEGKAKGSGLSGDLGQVEPTTTTSSSRNTSSHVGSVGAAGAVASQDRADKRKIGDKGGQQQEEALAKETRGNKESNGAPSNFSRVDPSLPRAELAERFPLFLGAESCTVEVEAGQMLYLPAGWFHEVKSIFTRRNQSEKKCGQHSHSMMTRPEVFP